MSALQRRQILAIVGTAIGGITLSGCLNRDRNQPSTQTLPETPMKTRTKSPPTDTPTTTPTTTSAATPTETIQSTKTPTSTDTPTQESTSTPTPTSTEIPFAPLATYSSTKYGYQIAYPKPWSIEDDEIGNKLELSDKNDLALLKVVVNRNYQRAGSTSLANRLPGTVGITSHEKTQTTHEGQPALRFERSYLATSNGPMVRVEGLITSTNSYIYTVQCGIVVKPFDDPHTTQTRRAKDTPAAVEWTSTIEQAATNIIGSFTYKN